MTEPVARERGHSALRSLLADRLGTPVVTSFGRAIWPSAVSGPLSVLIYHRILEKPDPLLPYEITADEFRHDMKMLASRFRVLDVSEGIQRLREGTLPPYAVCITFDDGYRDNCTVASPILQEFGLRATFFIATGYLDNGRMWNDTLLEMLRAWPETPVDLTDWGVPLLPMQTLEQRRRTLATLFRWMRRIGVRGRAELLDRLQRELAKPLPNDLMMTAQHVRALADAGMGIGCHTETHPILTRISNRQALEEISVSRAQLEGLIDRPVRYFAYPNGVPGDDYNADHVEIVRQSGFEAAFSTAWGAANQASDLFQLPRFTPWDKTSAGFALRLILSRRQQVYRQAA